MSADAMVVGTHLLTREGEDLLILAQRGDFLLADAQRMNAEILAMLTQVGRAFIIVDQTHARKTPPDARRCIAEWNQQHTMSGAVIFGGSATARAMATLVVTAIRILRPDGTPTAFTATEAQAREWIAARRKKLFPG